jgi:hypothetical protein
VSSYPRNEQIAALPTEALAAYAAVRTVFEAAPLQGLLRIPDPRGVHQLFSSALSESCSRSACAFPMMSNASEWSPTGIQATRSGRGAFPTRRTRRTASNGSDDSPIIGNGPHRPALPHPVAGPFDHVRRIQALSAQDRTLLTIRRRLALGDNTQLVFRDE